MRLPVDYGGRTVMRTTKWTTGYCPTARTRFCQTEFRSSASNNIDDLLIRTSNSLPSLRSYYKLHPIICTVTDTLSHVCLGQIRLTGMYLKLNLAASLSAQRDDAHDRLKAAPPVIFRYRISNSFTLPCRPCGFPIRPGVQSSRTEIECSELSNWRRTTRSFRSSSTEKGLTN
jgi:hypothetical protein